MSPAALSNGRSTVARWVRWRPVAAPPRRRRPGAMRRCRVSMRPVEQRRPRPVNPDASHYLRWPWRQAACCASVACVPRGPCGQGESAGSAGPQLAVLPHVPGASTPGCSSAGHGRSGCTAEPGCGNVRTGTGGPDGPCTPRTNRSAGRTRPSAPHCCGTAFIGTVSGAARSSSFQARETAAAPTFFGFGHGCSARCGCDPGRRMPQGPDSAGRHPGSQAPQPTDSGATPAWPPCRAARQANKNQPNEVLMTSLAQALTNPKTAAASSPPNRRGS
jgi:hypothetical protein